MNEFTELRTFIKDKSKLEKDSNFFFDILDKQIEHFKNNIHHTSLEYKHIICKRYKERYSIRVDKNYRILLNKIGDNQYEFVRLVGHAEYDRLTKSKNC